MEDSGVRLAKGETRGGAIFAIAPPPPTEAVPFKLLLLAHGYRSPQLPLGVDLADNPSSLKMAYVKELTGQGWVVAATSYRRNGWIVRDAIQDIELLRDYVVEHYGRPSRTLLMGDSMGGAIVTLMAEAEQGQSPQEKKYHGVVAVGAALDDPTMPHPHRAADSPPLSRRPRIPILYLTNQSELYSPQCYVEGCKRHADPDLVPAFWTVYRDGHCNVNAKERLQALMTVDKWIEASKLDERVADGTVHPKHDKSFVIFKEEGGKKTAHSKILEIDVHGKLITNVQPTDVEAIGITRFNSFLCNVKPAASRDATEVRVLYGTDYEDVIRGGWVGFVSADGYLVIARNMESAARTIGAAAGDDVTIATAPAEPDVP